MRNPKQLMLNLSKDSSRFGWPAGGLQDDLRDKDGCSLKRGVRWSLKCNLSLMRGQKPLRSLRNSFSFNFLCIGAKSRPFPRTFISVSVRTILLWLNTVSDTKIPDNLHFFVRTDRMLVWDWLLTWFRGHWRSSKMLKIYFL